MVLEPTILKFHVLAYFDIDTPKDVKYWERRAFSNPVSAKYFAELVINSKMAKYISKIIYVKFANWIVVGLGVRIPSWDFINKFDECYGNLCDKVGGVYLEAIDDFADFLMSDWLEGMQMAVFSENLNNLFYLPIERHPLAKINLDLKSAIDRTKIADLSKILERISEEYLAIKPTFREGEKIFEIMKLISGVADSLIKNIYRMAPKGYMGSKTFGQLVKELINIDFFSTSLNFRLKRMVTYRNEVEHYEITSSEKYEFDNRYLEIFLADLNYLIAFCLNKGIL